MEQKEIELTYEERATFGECPVCGSLHGEWCLCNDEKKVHLGRLTNAPTKKIIIYK